MNKSFPRFALRRFRTHLAIVLAYLTFITPLAPVFAQAVKVKRTTAPATAQGAGQPGKGKGGTTVGTDKHITLPAPNAVAAVNIVATKTDAFPDPNTDGKADPGETITYTVTVTNNGTTDATGVQFNDTIDPNTTLVPGSINTQPIATNDSITATGNIAISAAAPGVLSNDTDPDGNTLTVTQVQGSGANVGVSTATTATGRGGVTGFVTLNSDGSYTYEPPPGFTGSTDTFTYTASDGTSSDTATVTITISQMVWFISNSAGGSNRGTFSDPFTSIAAFNTANTGAAPNPQPNDFIALRSGTYSEADGINLRSGQRLIGEAVQFNTVFTADAASVSAYQTFASGTQPAPTITTTAGNGVDLNSGNTVRGLNVGAVAGGAKIFGSSFGALTIGNNTTPDVSLSGAGQALNLTTGSFTAASGFGSVATTSSTTQGIILTGVTGGPVSFGSTTVSGATTQGILVQTGTTADINFGNTTVTGGSNGVSFQNNNGGTRTFGTLGVSGGSGNAFQHSAGGGNVTVSGAATLSSTGNPVDIQNVANGTTISFAGGATVSKTSAGGAAVNWGGTNTGATLSFASLGLTTSNGPGLVAAGGGTINVTTGTISATGSAGQAAPAISSSGVTLGATFTSVSSTNSGNSGNGISLTNTLGTLTMNGGSISGAAGASFLVSGGSPTVTYKGDVTQNNAARLIDIQNTTSGTITFNTGTLTGGASSTGVNISGANGNVSFANLNLGTSGSRMTNQAVTITNGTGTYGLGAISIFTSGAQGIGSTGADGTLNATGTVDAVNGTAISIDGPVGLTTLGISLTKVSSSGASRGIDLQDTNGSFTVTGTGGTCTDANQSGCSGGTIASTTGADDSSTNPVGTGIVLNNVTNISLTRMWIHDHPNYCINGTSVSGLTFDNSVINGSNGTNVNSPFRDSDMSFDNLTGTVNITNSFVSGGVLRNIEIINTSGTLNLTVNNCNIHDTGKSPFTGGLEGDDGISLENQLTANITAHITNNTFSQHSGDHFNGTLGGTGAITYVITGNHYSNTLTGGRTTLLGGGFFILAAGFNSPGTFNYKVSDNGDTTTPLTGNNSGGAIVVNKGSGSASFSGRIENNWIGNPASVGSGSQNAGGIQVEAHGSGAHTTLINNNKVRQYHNSGIELIGGESSGVAFDATITNNTVSNPDNLSGASGHGVHLNMGTLPADTLNACMDVKTNILTGAGEDGDTGTFNDGQFDLRIRQRQSAAVAVRLPGFAGGANADAFESAQNTLTTVATTAITTFGGGAACATAANPSIVNQIDEPPPSASAATTKTQPDITDAPFVSLPVVAQAKPAKVKAEVGAEAQLDAARAQQPEQPPVSKSEGGAKQSKPTTPIVNATTDTVSVNIGTLRANDSVTITFQVTVNTPYQGGPNVSNQGTVSGTNFSNVLTDDTAVVGAADPTLTPINAINIRANDAKAAEPTTGSAPMLFTVTLSAPAPAGGLTVNYATADGGTNPATSSNVACDGTFDYQSASGTLGIPAGQRVGTIPVNVCADADNAETDETLLLNLSTPVGGNIVDTQAVGTITPANAAGTFIISELRTTGPDPDGAGPLDGANNDFVEFYNNTGSPVTVTASDTSAGYGVFKMGTDCDATPILIGTIPNGTVIPARGHYLLTGSAYSLADYGGTGAAAGNLTMTSDIETDHNVAVFSTADDNNISTAALLDAVGFGTNTNGVCALLKEGTPLPPVGAQPTVEHSYFRNLATGLPADSNDNAADFFFADTQATAITGLPQHLGAPGPENLASPINRGANIKSLLLDSSVSSSTTPNRERNSAATGPNAAAGTLSIRRRFTNNTGADVTRLRFRVVNITSAPTQPPASGVADVRLITSADVVVGPINDATTCSAAGAGPAPCSVTVRGTTLETPPAQPNGGAYNSTVAAGTISSIAPLAPGASINVQFLLGVQQTGSFAFFVIVEALP